MGLNHDETMAAITGNDPVIRPMQRWALYSEDARPVKVLLILAKHPEPHGDGIGHPEGGRTQWIYREEPVHGNQIVETTLSWIPEYNLRRLFALDREHTLPPAQAEATGSLSLPYTAWVETAPGAAAITVDFKTDADIDRMARDFFAGLSVLEGIASFASGTAGDEAMAYLKRIGVWSERVERVDG